MKILHHFLLAVSLASSGSAFAFTVSPEITLTGQALRVTCNPQKETFCQQLCRAKECLVEESDCRACAGTHNLKLKRILDSVGGSIVATQIVDQSRLLRVLKEKNFISIHPVTLFNYSNAYDGSQINGQFHYLCPNIPEDSLKTGILLLSVSPEKDTPAEVLGAICPDEKTGQSSYHLTNSRFQSRQTYYP